jgi:hypothetical protein
MRSLSKIVAIAGLGVLAVGAAFATPTTNVWNPSTDVQAVNTVHLGIDNYFSIKDNGDKPYAFPTDVGVTYGLAKGLEVGFDLLEPTKSPLAFNAKYATPESAKTPAFAVGLQAFGTSSATEGNIVYGLLAKTFGENGRITLGGYTGKKSVLGGDKSGVIAAWDKTFTPKWWGSVDYASGNNTYGALSFGASYKFASNIGLLFGYVAFNDSALNPNDTFTTQLDIDL